MLARTPPLTLASFEWRQRIEERTLPALQTIFMEAHTAFGVKADRALIRRRKHSHAARRC